MKEKIEKLSQLAVQSASTARRGLSTVQSLAQHVGQQVIDQAESKGKAAVSVALEAGRTVQQSLTEVISHETTQGLIEHVKETGQQIVEGASSGAKMVGSQVLDGVKKIDDKLEENHQEIKEKTELVSMGMGIAAGVAAGAAVVGPPLVVAAAPVIGAAATVTGAVAGGAYFYSRWKTNSAKKDVESDTPKGKE